VKPVVEPACVCLLLLLLLPLLQLTDLRKARKGRVVVVLSSFREDISHEHCLCDGRIELQSIVIGVYLKPFCDSVPAKDEQTK
jgi:hypothetical protein